MKIRKLLALTLALAMIPGLCACVRKKPEADRDQLVTGSIVGKYWIERMIDDGEVMTKDILKQFGWDGSFLQLNEDGTALFSFVGQKTMELRYDEKDCVLFSDAGKEMKFTVSGDRITLDYDGSQMIFLREKAPQPTLPTTQPTEPQPTESQPTEPQPTEPQPTEPQPTESRPTEPQPTESQPTEPKPTEPQPTEPADVRAVGKYWLYALEIEGELIDRETLEMAGQMGGGLVDSYILFREDGTVQMQLSDKEPRELVCDYETMRLLDDGGSYVPFRLVGDTVQILDDEDKLLFAPEGSDYLK